MEDYQLPKGGGAVLDHLPGRGQREVYAVWEDYCVPVYSSAPGHGHENRISFFEQCELYQQVTETKTTCTSGR